MTPREKRWWSQGQLKVEQNPQIILPLPVKTSVCKYFVSLLFDICGPKRPDTFPWPLGCTWGVMLLPWILPLKSDAPRLALPVCAPNTEFSNHCFLSVTPPSSPPPPLLLPEDPGGHRQYLQTRVFCGNDVFSVIFLNLVRSYFVVILSEFRWGLLLRGAHREWDCVRELCTENEGGGFQHSVLKPLSSRTVRLPPEQHPRGWARSWWGPYGAHLGRGTRKSLSFATVKP